MEKKPGTEGKTTVLISGASSGIGEASARLFGREGYRVYLAARRVDLLQAIAEEIKLTGGEATPVPADLDDLEAIQSLVETVQAEAGSIDILFNNAGIGRMDWLQRLDPREDIEAQINVNLIGLIELTQAVIPGMIERRSGHIINMASMAGFVGLPTYSIYAASKFGVRGFSEALRREVAVHNIKVSVIYPGGVANGFARKARIKRKTGITTPSWLRLSDEDVASAVLRLVHRPRPVMMIPWQMRVAAWLNNIFPGVLDWGIEKVFVNKELD